MFSLIGALVIGLIVGAIAKLLMPGKDPGGKWITMALGFAGSLIANTWGEFSAGMQQASPLAL